MLDVAKYGSRSGFKVISCTSCVVSCHSVCCLRRRVISNESHEKNPKCTIAICQQRHAMLPNVGISNRRVLTFEKLTKYMLLCTFRPDPLNVNLTFTPRKHAVSYISKFVQCSFHSRSRSSSRCKVRCSIKTPWQVFRTYSTGCFSFSCTSQAEISYCTSPVVTKSRTS